MPIPPPSIILILVLGGLDVLLTLLLASVLGRFDLNGLHQRESWWQSVAPFLAVAAFPIALKIVSMIGLYLARRWGVVLGVLALGFSPTLVLWAVLRSADVGAIIPAVAVPMLLVLACTLPHWRRMVWRFP